MTKYIIIGVVLIALAGAAYGLRLHVQNLTLERDAAVLRADQYEKTLSAYQDAFSSQVEALNSERRQEIMRQENLLATLNLIGDMNEADNLPIPATSLSIIDRLYGYAAAGARDAGPAADSR